MTCCLTPSRWIRVLKIFLSCWCSIDMHWRAQGHYSKLFTLSVISQDLQVQIQPSDGALRLRSGMRAFALGSSTVSVHPFSTPSDPHFSPVKNHSIPSSLPQRVISSSLPFFALPEEEKLKYDIRKSSNFKGYNALLSGNEDPEGRATYTKASILDGKHWKATTVRRKRTHGMTEAQPWEVQTYGQRAGRI